uniref:Uncharacterized protein n=1 Tax=Arundo donax TaxID=35708 RepID=A0A0A9CWJ9_ARUDO
METDPSSWNFCSDLEELETLTALYVVWSAPKDPKTNHLPHLIWNDWEYWNSFGQGQLSLMEMIQQLAKKKHSLDFFGSWTPLLELARVLVALQHQIFFLPLSEYLSKTEVSAPLQSH